MPFYQRTDDGRIYRNPHHLSGDFDLNSLLESVKGSTSSGGTTTDGTTSGGSAGGANIDSKGLASGLTQFSLDKIQDFAKKEQDNYSNPQARDQKGNNDNKVIGQTIGAVAGLAICTAVGVGPNPICGLVGGFIGGLISGLFNSPTLSPEGQKIWDKYFKPAGYSENSHEFGKAEAAARVWSAYGFDRMDSIVKLIHCAKEKNILLGDSYPEHRNETIFWWIPFDDKRHDALIVNELGDWAHENKGKKSIDTDVDGIFKWQIQMLYGMLNRDRRCLDEANNETMRGFALAKMFDAGIYTPQAVRQYSNYYDDGQKESHNQVLDKCSAFAQAYDEKTWEVKNGKCVETSKKDDSNSAGANSVLSTLKNPLLVTPVGIGLSFLAYKHFTR